MYDCVSWTLVITPDDPSLIGSKYAPMLETKVPFDTAVVELTS